MDLGKKPRARVCLCVCKRVCVRGEVRADIVPVHKRPGGKSFLPTGVLVKAASPFLPHRVAMCSKTLLVLLIYGIVMHCSVYCSPAAGLQYPALR